MLQGGDQVCAAFRMQIRKLPGGAAAGFSRARARLRRPLRRAGGVRSRSQSSFSSRSRALSAPVTRAAPSSMLRRQWPVRPRAVRSKGAAATAAGGSAGGCGAGAAGEPEGGAVWLGTAQARRKGHWAAGRRVCPCCRALQRQARAARLSWGLGCPVREFWDQRRLGRVGLGRQGRGQRRGRVPSRRGRNNRM